MKEDRCEEEGSRGGWHDDPGSKGQGLIWDQEWRGGDGFE